jgi:hypothetical protein
LQTPPGGVKITASILPFPGKFSRMNRSIVIVVLTFSLLAAGARAGGKEAFVDYYATASTLISTLNNVAADLERMNLPGGDFSDEVADDVRSRLVKAREGFNSILTYDDNTSELNEGYVLYIDKMLLALLVAKEYREKGDPEKRDRLSKLLAESGQLRAELSAGLQRDKKKWGVD